MTPADDTTTLIVPKAGCQRPVEVRLAPNMLAGRYHIEGELGKGGMAVVYRATDLETNEVRAVKVGLLSSHDDAFPERMAAEATMLMFLRHPNVIAVHDMGTDPALGLHFAVMDYAPGGSLGERRDAEGHLPADEVAAVGVQLLCALSVLHGRGILHRDVKPTNLLLDAEGRVLLTDLGISKLPDALAETTNDDLVMGSYSFMAPEQLTGMDQVSQTGDLYAVGTTLFNLATGLSSAHLFAVREDAKRWQALPEVLRAVIRHATQLEPDDRPASAWAMARELALVAPAELFDRQPHLTAWLEEGDPERAK